MSIAHQKSQNRRGLYVALAVVILAVALMNVLRQQQRPDQSNQVWYYDLQAGNLFAAEADLIPPIESPSGAGNGVRAHVISCGACDAEGRQIAYLESNTDEAKEILENMPDAADPETDVTPYVMKAQQGQLIAPGPKAGEAPAWKPGFGPAADDIRSAARKLCGGDPRQCRP